MRKLLFIIALLILSAPAVAENIMMPHIDIHQTLNPNKNVSDAMIENFYKHPEYIPVIDKECAETMGWVKGNFAFFEPLHHRAVFCLAWETNKKLNKEQIELLAQLNKAWSNVIMDLYQSDTYRNSFAVSFDNEQEYSLQLAVRIYNIVTQQKWPECFYETNEKDTKIMYTPLPHYSSAALRPMRHTGTSPVKLMGLRAQQKKRCPLRVSAGQKTALRKLRADFCPANTLYGT